MKCKKCNSENLILIEKRLHNGIYYCKDCLSFIKCVSKKELPIINHILNGGK